MAEAVGFEYALVQYQWPSWLHKQTNKQRIIWGCGATRSRSLETFPPEAPFLLCAPSRELLLRCDPADPPPPDGPASSGTRFSSSM